MGEEGLHNSYSVAVNGSTLEVPGRVAPTDGGAAFVLESKGDAFFSASLHRKPSPLAAGSWWHAGFHLTTAIVGPTILTLPYAFRGLAWGLGLASLTAVGAVTFYAYSLMSKV